MKRLLIAMYMLLYSSQLLIAFGDSPLWVSAILMALSSALACANAANAIAGAKSLRADEKKQRSHNRIILSAKLAAMPFFAFNYFAWSLFAGAILLSPGMLILIAILPLAIGFTYSILLATSSYSISLLYALRKNGAISRKQFVVHSVLQLIFVVDVIDQIVIYRIIARPSSSS
jgi:hypothetical protein